MKIFLIKQAIGKQLSSKSWIKYFVLKRVLSIVCFVFLSITNLIAEMPNHQTPGEEFDDFLNFAIDRTHRYYLPKYPIQIKTFRSSYFSLKNFDIKHEYYSLKKPLIGSVTKDPNDLELVNNLLVRVHAQISDKTERTFSTDEILAKIVSYRNLRQGAKVFVPSLAKDGVKRLKVYIVDKVFDLGGNMPAFGLIPKEGKHFHPLLIFRGTDLGNSASVKADLDFESPGYSVYQSNRKNLRAWCEKVSKRFPKPRILGYSLGGAFTQYMAIFDKDLISMNTKQPNIMFNQPGVSKELQTMWYQIAKSDRPPLVGYINEGDLVSTVNYLIGDVYELSLDTLLDPIEAHVVFISAKPVYYRYKLDLTMKFDKSLSFFKSLKKTPSDKLLKRLF